MLIARIHDVKAVYLYIELQEQIGMNKYMEIIEKNK